MSLGLVEGNKEVLGASGFPYGLEDLSYWIIKRKDGTIVKYLLEDDRKTPQHASDAPLRVGKSAGFLYRGTGSKSLSQFCKHDPISPIFETKTVKLFIADAIGARMFKEKFDFVLDCGDIFRNTYTATPTPILAGDPELAKALSHHSIRSSVVDTRILQIDWDDREAPDLSPEFWGELAGMLKGRVMIACQGGHGRSGTALTSLMMVLNPEYSPKDAITHLRAIHCPRAIESADQHQYLSLVGKCLGRTANGKEINKVKDFRSAFLGMTHKSAKPYQTTLKGTK